MLTAASAGLAAMGAWLLADARLLPAPPVARRGAARPGLVDRGAPVAIGGGLVGGALVAGLPLLLVPTIALLGWAGSVLVARARRDAQSAARRGRVVDACEALLGELVAGQPPGRALDAAASAWDELAPAARAARLGADVPTAVRLLARQPGAGALDRLAGAWQLCGSSGSGLATALEQVLGSVRAEHEVSLAVRAELASARATARLLAVLPAMVLVMAQGIGARPWHFLLASVPGQLCLGVGAGLAVTGVMWLERIADEAQGERR